MADEEQPGRWERLKEWGKGKWKGTKERGRRARSWTRTKVRENYRYAICLFDDEAQFTAYQAQRRPPHGITVIKAGKTTRNFRESIRLERTRDQIGDKLLAIAVASERDNVWQYFRVDLRSIPTGAELFDQFEIHSNVSEKAIHAIIDQQANLGEDGYFIRFWIKDGANEFDYKVCVLDTDEEYGRYESKHAKPPTNTLLPMTFREKGGTEQRTQGTIKPNQAHDVFVPAWMVWKHGKAGEGFHVGADGNPALDDAGSLKPIKPGQRILAIAVRLKQPPYPELRESWKYAKLKDITQFPDYLPNIHDAMGGDIENIKEQVAQVTKDIAAFEEAMPNVLPPTLLARQQEIDEHVTLLARKINDTQVQNETTIKGLVGETGHSYKLYHIELQRLQEQFEVQANKFEALKGRLQGRMDILEEMERIGVDSPVLSKRKLALRPKSEYERKLKVQHINKWEEILLQGGNWKAAIRNFFKSAPEALSHWIFTGLITMRGRPLSGVLVQILDEEGSNLVEGTSGRDGRYLISRVDLPAQIVRIEAQSGQYAAEGRVDLRGFSDNRVDMDLELDAGYVPPAGGTGPGTGAVGMGGAAGRPGAEPAPAGGAPAAQVDAKIRAMHQEIKQVLETFPAEQAQLNDWLRKLKAHYEQLTRIPSEKIFEIVRILKEDQQFLEDQKSFILTTLRRFAKEQDTEHKRISAELDEIGRNINKTGTRRNIVADYTNLFEKVQEAEEQVARPLLILDQRVEEGYEQLLKWLPKATPENIDSIKRRFAYLFNVLLKFRNELQLSAQELKDIDGWLQVLQQKLREEAA